MKPNGQTRQARGPEHAADPAEQVRGLLKSYGQTYAQEAGIRLADKPGQDRVDALGRGHYRRYDESTARCSATGRPGHPAVPRRPAPATTTSPQCSRTVIARPGSPPLLSAFP